ncbi:hypothetical protein JYT72_02380 [Crocinitomix catalasitica]|nr:hypothetical protein [Crocinitomix catalasitica]
MSKRLCLNCQEEVDGRIDKLYCTPYCKSAYHYQNKKFEGKTMFKNIDETLKRNRKLLAHYNSAGKAIIRKETLLKTGFNPNFFTHYYKTDVGDVYLFCYEFGFLSTIEKGKPKFLLVHWQDYMNRKLKIPE